MLKVLDRPEREGNLNSISLYGFLTDSLWRRWGFLLFGWLLDASVPSRSHGSVHGGERRTARAMGVGHGRNVYALAGGADDERSRRSQARSRLQPTTRACSVGRSMEPPKSSPSQVRDGSWFDYLNLQDATHTCTACIQITARVRMLCPSSSSTHTCTAYNR